MPLLTATLPQPLLQPHRRYPKVSRWECPQCSFLEAADASMGHSGWGWTPPSTPMSYLALQSLRAMVSLALHREREDVHTFWMIGRTASFFEDDLTAASRPWGRCESGTRTGLCRRIAFFFCALPIVVQWSPRRWRRTTTSKWNFKNHFARTRDKHATSRTLCTAYCAGFPRPGYLPWPSICTLSQLLQAM